MRHLIVYGIWAKPDVIPWHINCIRRRTSQHKADVLFVFDTYDEISVRNYDRLCGHDARVWDRYIAHDPIYEVGVHRVAIEYALEREYTSVLVFQDDAGLLHQDIIGDVERLFALYGDRIGVIGGRDGYFRGLHNIHASHWSRTERVMHWIAPGIHSEVDLLNTGPWIYHRSVMEKLGTPSLDYGHFHAWEEYSLRCKEAGLQNLLLGTNILHEAFGYLEASTLYNDNKQNMKHARMMEKRWEEYDEKLRKQNG